MRRSWLLPEQSTTHALSRRSTKRRFVPSTHSSVTGAGLSGWATQIEAGKEHSAELATLRQSSQGAAEQLRSAHQTEIDALKASHQEALDSQIKSLEKQISGLKLELTATQDALSKAKAALAAGTAEAQSLKTRIAELQAEAETSKAAAAAEHQTAMEDIAKQLSNTQREMSDLNVSPRPTFVNTC